MQFYNQSLDISKFCERGHCSQTSFLPESIYLHYSWFYCCVVAVKHLSIQWLAYIIIVNFIF